MAKSPMSPDGAHLIGTFFGAALYAIYNYLVYHLFLHVKRGRVRSKVITAALIVLWICTTASVGLRTAAAYVAFVSNANSISPRTFYHEEYKKTWSPPLRFEIASNLNSLFADSLLCWRVYMVWGRNKVVLILPICLLVCFTCCILGHLTHEAKNGDDEATCQAILRWQLGAVVFTLAGNILNNGLICWKIRRVGMDISGHSVSSKQLYWHLIHVTAESGVLYTISLLSYVIARASKAIHVSIIITHIIPPITGIVPVLVILRMFSTPKTPERTTFHRVESPSSKARHEVAATQPPVVVVEGTRSEDLEASGNPLGEQPNDDPSSTITRRRAHKQDESDITQSLVNCEPIL